jgi:hypothetical protein
LARAPQLQQQHDGDIDVSVCKAAAAAFTCICATATAAARRWRRPWRLHGGSSSFCLAPALHQLQQHNSDSNGDDGAALTASDMQLLHLQHQHTTYVTSA